MWRPLSSSSKRRLRVMSSAKKRSSVSSWPTISAANMPVKASGELMISLKHLPRMRSMVDSEVRLNTPSPRLRARTVVNATITLTKACCSSSSKQLNVSFSSVCHIVSANLTMVASSYSRMAWRSSSMQSILVSLRYVVKRSRTNGMVSEAIAGEARRALLSRPFRSAAVILYLSSFGGVKSMGK